MKKKVPINCELEIIFLNSVYQTLQDLKLKNECYRESFSSSVNSLFNGSWSKDSEWVKRGSFIGILKGGETTLNESTVGISDLQQLVSGRIRELKCCLVNDKRVKNDKRTSDSKVI